MDVIKIIADKLHGFSMTDNKTHTGILVVLDSTMVSICTSCFNKIKEIFAICTQGAFM
jgi:hypothetical protein